jgi:RimJ/RimL family protein N-acetyltransferase
MHDALSQRLWALDWSALLPWTLEDGVQLECGSVEDVLAFVRDRYATIFATDPDDRRFLHEQPSVAKQRFLECSDRFAFREKGRVIGVLVGNPVDWSTYYWRTVAFLPEHQGRGLLAAALARTDEVMRAAGIERVEGDAAPANYRQVRLLLRLGYCITGQNNSERWGAMLRLTKFLRHEAEHVFLEQFCKDSKLPGHPARKSKEKGAQREEIRNRLLLGTVEPESAALASVLGGQP